MSDQVLTCGRCCHDGTLKSQMFQKGWTLVAMETGRLCDDTLLLALCPRCTKDLRGFMAKTPAAEQLKEDQR